MGYEIIWSENSLQDYSVIIEYLISKWPPSVAMDFVDTVNKKLNNLSKLPLVGIRSDKDPSIRSLLLTSHNRLYYSISESKIELLAIIDTRSNPEKNPF
jgi:plasmid stabilization system protein ParE